MVSDKLYWCLVWNIVEKFDVSVMFQVPLRYLISMLFANFSLMWKPVIDLIKSHALGLNMNSFWEVYSVMLEQAATNAGTCDFQRKLCSWISYLFNVVCF